MTSPDVPQKKIDPPLEPETRPFPMPKDDVEILFAGLTGSHAYGMATPESDEDWRGIFAYHPTEYLGLHTPAVAIEVGNKQSEDYTYWELAHYCRMLLKGSVNATELLWLPRKFVYATSPEWDMLVEQRFALMAEPLWKAWNGVITGYRAELAKPGHLKDAERRKHLAHVYRFCFTMFRAVSDYRVIVTLPETVGDFVRAIRSGDADEATALDNAMDFRDAAQRLYASKPWPEQPPRETIERLVINQRLSRLQAPC